MKRLRICHDVYKVCKDRARKTGTNSEVSPEQSSERILFPGAGYLHSEGKAVHLLRGHCIVLFETRPETCLRTWGFYLSTDELENSFTLHSLWPRSWKRQSRLQRMVNNMRRAGRTLFEPNCPTCDERDEGCRHHRSTIIIQSWRRVHKPQYLADVLDRLSIPLSLLL